MRIRIAALFLCASLTVFSQSLNVTGTVAPGQISGSGTIAIGVLPTGSSSSTVAIGNDARFGNATSLNGTSILSLTGVLKLTSGTPSNAAAADMIALWSGTCSSSTFLRGDGTCTTPGGGGTVTSVGWTGGIVSIATATSTPAFSISGTSGGIPYFSSTSTWASSGALTANGVVLGGGAGAAPTSTAADTNTTHAFFATGTAPAFRAIVSGDLPTVAVAQGGTGTASTLTGLVRGSASAMTAAELSGDVTTSGSNAATVVKVNGGTVPASSHVLGSNSSSQPVAATANDISAITYVTGGGTAQAQTATYSPAVSLVTGLEVQFLPVAANSGAGPTLAVNGLTAKPITKNGTAALVANDLTTSAIADVIYDGSNWELQNPQTLSFSNLSGSATTGQIPSAIPVWNSYTIGFASVQTASTSTSVTIVSLGAKVLICGLVGKVGTAFAGTSITGMTAIVGDSVGGAGYYSPVAYNLLATVSNTNFFVSNVTGLSTFAGSNLQANFTSTGANLSALTAGSLTYDVCTVSIP